ncbi:MAG TPA: phosphatase PAP2 family protein [Streptosporangiaceae bacterium]|nr:phosphatase PAP2 family protein [Streptosporangiaceae bacterium]
MAQITKKTTTRSILVSLPPMCCPCVGRAEGQAPVGARGSRAPAAARWYPATQWFNPVTLCDQGIPEPTELACGPMGPEDQVAVAADVSGRPGRRPGGLAAPLLPSGVRRPAVIIALGCLVLVVTLGVLYAHQSHGRAIDQTVDSWVMGLHIRSGTLELISQLGDAPAMTVMTAALALGCLTVRRLSGAVLAVAGVLLALGLTEAVLKPLVHRTITASHFVTYPSGHTTALFALSTALTVVLVSATPRRVGPAVVIGVIAVAVVVSGAVGMAMIGLGFHYFTDTVAGAAVGIGVVLATALLLDLDVIRRWLGRFSR